MVPPGVPTRLGAFGVWGSGTGVGKTLVSAGIFAAARRRGLPALYLKPVQTGFPADSDGALVAALGGGCAHALGAHAAAAAGRPLASADADSRAPCRTLFAWAQPVSPHLAVEREGRAAGDAEVTAATRDALVAFARSAPAPVPALALVETAGGPASPGPSGTLQVDLLRPLRLPCLLVGDGGLGGISSSLCAHDALTLRGLDVPALVLLDGGLGNGAAIARHTARAGTAVFTLPPLRKPAGGGEAPRADVAAWLDSNATDFDAILGALGAWHAARLAALDAAPADAERMFWWPFTQHALAAPVTVIDSRCGDEFTIHANPAAPAAAPPAAAAGGSAAPLAEAELAPAFDACASWWTQGAGSAAQPELTRALAYAAARWGHVMFPENAHEAALGLCRRLLAGAGRGWASRVFFSDDGSTAMEIAFKMAFRRFYASRGLLRPPGAHAAGEPPGAEGEAAQLPPLLVVALANSYHGDTLGAMDAQPPSVFTGPMQSPWYTPRGIFLEPPSLALRGGAWTLELPAELGAAAAAAGAGASAWHARADAFDLGARLGSPLAAVYRAAVRSTLDGAARGAALPAAVILEPILQGAGGMILVDPLYQRVLCEEARARELPIIFDEVFVGCYRLGVASTAAMLGIAPDIACYAKLLTGGTVPMAVTLASEPVFEAFRGLTKPEALLHGHSYSAHAIGCSVACTALDTYADAARNPNFVPLAPAPAAGTAGAAEARPIGALSALSGGWAGAHFEGSLRELWDEESVRDLSRLPSVERAIAIGTVFAAAIRTEHAGYASTATRELVRRLQAHGIRARPLGNVVYLMCAPTTERSVCAQMLAALRLELESDAMAAAAFAAGSGPGKETAELIP